MIVSLWRWPRQHNTSVPYKSESVANTDLLDLLEAQAGIVCLVGAGGKKTTMYRLAELHSGKVAITTTVHTPPFPRRLDALNIVEPGESLLRQVLEHADRHQRIAYATPSTKTARLGPVPPEVVEQIHVEAHYDLTLVKCDGARLRLMKAPGEGEPALPLHATTILPVISIRVVGRPLSDRIAHRVDLISRITGARPGEIITHEHIARLLVSEEGGLKGVGRARPIPMINMVENREQLELATRAGERALELRPDLRRILLTAMTREEPVVRVISQEG